jgi:hypothetical protein
LRLQTLPAPCHRRESAASTLPLTLVSLLPLPHHRCPARVCGVSTATASAPPRPRDRRGLRSSTSHPPHACLASSSAPCASCSPTRLLAAPLLQCRARRLHLHALHPRKGLQLRRRIHPSSTRAAPAEASRRTRAVSAAPCIAAYSLRLLVRRHPTPRRLMLESKVA